MCIVMYQRLKSDEKKYINGENALEKVKQTVKNESYKLNRVKYGS